MSDITTQSDQYGIKISQAGTNVKYAADYQLIFNSSWPSLQVTFDTTISLDPSEIALVPHNLKFYPLVMAWIIKDGVNLGRALGLSEVFEADPQGFVKVSWDNTNLYLENTSATAYDINIKCYNLDISQQVNYALPKPAVIAVKYDPDYGIKVTKYQKSIGSTDLRDFILNSQAQSPAVLAVVTKFTPLTGFGNSIQYTNPAGYTPWVYGFSGIITNGITRYTSVPTGPQQSGYLFQLGPTSYLIDSIGLDATHVGSIVVLRDPLVVPKRVEIIYNG